MLAVFQTRESLHVMGVATSRSGWSYMASEADADALLTREEETSGETEDDGKIPSVDRAQKMNEGISFSRLPSRATICGPRCQIWFWPTASRGMATCQRMVETRSDPGYSLTTRSITHFCTKHCEFIRLYN